MKKSFFMASLLSIALTSTVHAQTTDLGASELAGSTINTSTLTATADFAVRNTEIIALAAASNQYTENVALVNQLSPGGIQAYAYIDQSGGTGNLAAIMQDASVHAAVAVVFQSGSGSRAIINQH
jgi:hypothetical protein